MGEPRHYYNEIDPYAEASGLTLHSVSEAA